LGQGALRILRELDEVFSHSDVVLEHGALARRLQCREFGGAKVVDEVPDRFQLAEEQHHRFDNIVRQDMDFLRY
jgi:hypothetical protein